MQTVKTLLLSLLLSLFLGGSPMAQVGPSQDSIRARLQALEEAYQAGILTKEEYKRKRVALVAQLVPPKPALSKAAKKKLQALKEAYQAGILTKEEYARKRAEIVGANPKPPTPVPPPVNRPKIKLELFKDPMGRFLFGYPKGYRVRVLPDNKGVAIPRGAGAVAVMEWSRIANGDQIIGSWIGQLKGQLKDFKQLSKGKCKIPGGEAPLFEFTAKNPAGVQIHGQIGATGFQGKGYSFSRIGPEKDYVALGPAWDILLASIRFIPSSAKAGGKKGNTYRHTMGFNFWYPEGWQVKEKSDFLQIVPPAAAKNDKGPTEAYFVVGDQITDNAIQRPDDPRVITVLNRFVAKQFGPHFQRVGFPSGANNANGAGTVVDWEVQDGQGKTVRIRAYTTIIKRFGVTLLAFGYKDLVMARDSVLRKIFASFGMGQGKKDPALVGAWTLTEHTDIYAPPQAGSALSGVGGWRNEKETLEFRPDGTYVRICQWELLVMGGGINPITGATTMLDSGPQREVTQGTWSAEGGTVYMIDKKGLWDDWTYKVVKSSQGNKLVLRGEKYQDVYTRR